VCWWEGGGPNKPRLFLEKITMLKKTEKGGGKKQNLKIFLKTGSILLLS
jgi:hypothetical protein